MANVKKQINCCLCSNPAEHSITLREGVVADRTNNPKLKDTSRMRVIGFCGIHWITLKDFIGI